MLYLWENASSAAETPQRVRPRLHQGFRLQASDIPTEEQERIKENNNVKVVFSCPSLLALSADLPML